VTVDRFAGVRAKLARADHLVAEFTAAVEAWSDQFGLEVRHRMDGPWHVWFVPARPELEAPLDLAVLVGEVAHHLRSTLDHMAWVLVEANGGKPNRDTTFPVCHTLDAWNIAKRKCLRGASESVIAEIREYQPFAPGKPHPVMHPMAQLAEINNLDKHRTLIVTAPIIKHVEMKGRLPAGRYTTEQRDMKNGLPIDVDQDVARFQFQELEDGGDVPELRAGKATAGVMIDIQTLGRYRFAFPHTMLPSFVDGVRHLADDLHRFA
jgi:hypothetical protein